MSDMSADAEAVKRQPPSRIVVLDGGWDFESLAARLRTRF